MTIETFSMDVSKDDPVHSQSNQTLTAPGDSQALRLRAEILVQLAGSGTAVTAVVLRSPDGMDDNYSPAGEPIAGNQSAGVDIRRYDEPSRGFWKVRVTSVTGPVKVHLSGLQAS